MISHIVDILFVIIHIFFSFINCSPKNHHQFWVVIFLLMTNISLRDQEIRKLQCTRLSSEPIKGCFTSEMAVREEANVLEKRSNKTLARLGAFWIQFICESWSSLKHMWNMRQLCFSTLEEKLRDILFWFWTFSLNKNSYVHEFFFFFFSTVNSLVCCETRLRTSLMWQSSM